MCGAFVFRLLAVWFTEEGSMLAINYAIPLCAIVAKSLFCDKALLLFQCKIMFYCLYHLETLTAYFKTSLRTDFPFDTTEMLMYSIVG